MNMKRIVALMLGLVMLLSLSVVSAQEKAPAFNRQMAVIQSGKSIESTTTLNVNAETVGALLAQMQGESSAESMAQFSTLIGALNKLVIKSLTNMESETKELANITVGTDKAALVEAKSSVDMVSGDNAISVNLLPGLLLKMDQAQMASSLQQSMQLQQHPEMLMMLDEKYNKVVADAFAKEILPSLKTEEGAFDIEEGKFDTRMEGDITPVLAAKFVKTVAAVAKDDAELKQLLNTAIENGIKSAEKAAEAQGSSDPVPFKNADEALAQLNEKMDKVIAEGSAEKVLHLVAYSAKEANVMLVNIDTPYTDNSAYSLSMLTAPAKDGGHVKATVYVASPPYGTETPEPIDWAKVKEAVKAGEDFSTTVVTIDLNTKKDDSKLNYTLALQMAASGMPIAVSIAGDATLTGAYESNTKISLTFLSPDPLLEINTHAVESDKKAEAINAEGTQVFEIKADASEEDMAPLMQVLQEKGLPMLMENLSKALPDEAGLILQMLNGASQEGTTKAN